MSINSGPTPISSSIAGTPLGQTNLAAQKKCAASAAKENPICDGITDTLETSDREADGRQILQMPTQQPTESDGEKASTTETVEPEPGTRLDITG